MDECRATKKSHLQLMLMSIVISTLENNLVLVIKSNTHIPSDPTISTTRYIPITTHNCHDVEKYKFLSTIQQIVEYSNKRILHICEENQGTPATFNDIILQ